ncbi:MAG: hypothetical protein NTV38_15000 [Chloroflexi bacterium]|nr:hypothetical protein [Chloroflexota bacterium]
MRDSRLRLFLLLSVFCLLPIVSCVPASYYREWTVADLRLLDPLDDASTSSTDILAVYTRSIGSDLDIRVDLLDLPLTPDYHLQILLDTLPSGNPWDLTIDIPADGRPTVTPANSNILPRLIRDPWLDTVTVRFNRRYIPRPFTLKVISFIPGDSSPADETAPVRSDALPPTQRAPLALVFWDVFQADTPAQALRRWDGAHTGPRGERHGLKHILDNARLYGVPVALLDLKTPASLAALDYMGITPQIQNLTSHGLLILPDVAYGEPVDISLDFSRRAAAGFGLPASQFVYSTPSNLQSNYLAQFLPLDNSSHLARSGGTRLIPLPAADAIQATQDGPSLDVRRALVAAAFSGNPSDLVVLGGDLPHSTWGNENMAGPTFAWIAAHPWIQPLAGDDLITFPVGSHNVYLPATTSDSSPFTADLRTAPTNSLTDSAWQSYLMLTAPTSEQKLLVLRTNYLSQVAELLAASRWAGHPFAQADCDHDLNRNGQPECVLSNQHFFAILDPAGARLTNLFYIDQIGPHQLVGPSSQFTIGLSDPSEWHPELGQASDPSVIPGAFSDDTNTWMLYTPDVTPAGITFTSPDGSRVKNYRLLEDGIKITYQVASPVSTRIPLAVDPQAFILGPTDYSSASGSGAWTWGLADGIQVEVRTEVALSAQSFTDSFTYLSQPEDPDRAYPGGHYLPFPLSVVNLQSSGNFSVQITGYCVTTEPEPRYFRSFSLQENSSIYTGSSSVK